MKNIIIKPHRVTEKIKDEHEHILLFKCKGKKIIKRLMYNINTEHCRSEGWRMDKGLRSDQ